MLRKLLGLLLRPPFLQVGGLVLLTAVIFVGGRALRSVIGGSDAVLLLAIGAVWAIAGGVWLWRRYRSKQRAQMIEDRLRGQAREYREAVRPDRRADVEALEQQLTEALGALKTSKLGKSALYALPWYVIVGPPGSGKTTLLRESGLNFPQLTHGRGVRGVGGTRNCDWWFTDSGILLDTAGRYTTQAEDRDEWLAFLDMLKKARARKPINGALIAISIGDLLQATDEEVAEHARRIRERLAELTERLELVFPVYVLFTKCDLLDGFVDLFGSYTRKERAQAWGFTLPYLARSPEPLGERFVAEFDALHSRLCAERLLSLGGAKSPAKKRRIFSFPLQFVLARDRLRSFVEQLAQPNPFHESSDVRGFYFTSGTQEGTPLDQVVQSMREAVGLQAEPDPADAEVDKKAYFIDDLFTEVVFPDQYLAHSSAKAERRRRVLQRGAVITAAAATFALTVGLFVSYAGHANLIERAETVCRGAASFDPGNDDHLRREEDGDGPLEQLRRLYVELDDAYGALGTYVLGQTNELHDLRVRPLYVRKLRTTFVEPIQRQLQVQLAAAVGDGGKGRDVREIADQFTGYQMLGGEVLLNREWLGDDFLKRTRLWSWRGNREVEACRPHRDAFVGRVAGPAWSDWTFVPDEALIPAARDLVRGKDIYGRALQEVLQEQGAAELVPWRRILAGNAQAALLDDTIGVTKAWVDETPLDDVLDQRGALLGGNSADVLKTRRRQEAIDDWKQKLAAMRPRHKSNVEDAMRDVVALTGPDGVHVAAYREVCSRLDRLGVKCRAGDVAWLEQLAASINQLQAVVQPLYEARPLLDRIVPAAKKGDDGAIGKLRYELRKVRAQIRDKSDEYADIELKEAIQRSLIGTVDALQFALAREIQQETDKVWMAGVGKELAAFSRQFPFRADATDVVSGKRFDEVFARGGEFDQSLAWIRFLQQTVDEIGFAAPNERFQSDVAFAARLQAALFATGTAQCEVEFLLQKLGNMTSVRFALGSQKLEARATQNTTLTWRTVDDASIEVHEFQAFDAKVDSRLEQRGAFGLVRLLGAATPSTTSVRGKEYVVWRWTTFLHPATNQPLAVADARAEAALLLRTVNEPNPLTPGFFVHDFSPEVFRALAH